METDSSHFGATVLQEDCQSLRKPSLQSHPVQQRLQRRWQLRFTASLRRTRTALSSMCFCGGTSRRWLTPLRILLHGGCFSLAMDVLLSRGTWPCLCSSKLFRRLVFSLVACAKDAFVVICGPRFIADVFRKRAKASVSGHQHNIEHWCISDFTPSSEYEAKTEYDQCREQFRRRCQLVGSPFVPLFPWAHQQWCRFFDHHSGASTGIRDLRILGSAVDGQITVFLLSPVSSLCVSTQHVPLVRMRRSGFRLLPFSLPSSSPRGHSLRT